MSNFDFDVAILGAGTAGISAYREARKYTDNIALIDGGELGTTCARVGCMPSKLLIAAADAAYHMQHTDIFGVKSHIPEIDGKAVMHRVRSERDRFVGFVLEAIEGFDKGELIHEHAKFEDDHTLVTMSGRKITSKTVVIATGSRPNIPPALQAAGDRLIVNDDIFEWQDLPGSVAVLGTGVIGLELGQALHRLGVRIRLFGRSNNVGPLTDPVVNEYAINTFSAEFPAVWQAEPQLSREADTVVVRWSDAPADEERFEYIIAATGRRPNLDNIGLENTSLRMSDSGIPFYDRLSGRIGQSHVFVAGDAAVDLPLLHEAADEGRLAGENAARFPRAYRRARHAPLGVVFSSPQIAMIGQTFQALMKQNDCGFDIGEVSFESQGRARVMNINKGILRVYGEKNTGRFLGAEMIGPAAEHIAHLLAWAVQSNLTVEEMLQRPFYHPVIEEGVRTALRDLNYKLGFGPNPPLRCIDCGPGS